jgi:hypothetical protein
VPDALVAPNLLQPVANIGDEGTTTVPAEGSGAPVILRGIKVGESARLTTAVRLK